MRPTPKTAAITAVVLAVAALLSLMGLALAGKEPVTGRSAITRVGKPPPPFSFTLLGGEEFALSDYMGQPILINFWASWCPPCREEMPLLERAWQAYKDRGVVFIGVDIQDTEADANAFLREFNITYPNGLDQDGKITVDYGVIGLPLTLFVNRQGIIERRWVGAIGELQLRTWLDALVAGATLPGEAEGENLDEFFKLKEPP